MKKKKKDHKKGGHYTPATAAQFREEYERGKREVTQQAQKEVEHMKQLCRFFFFYFYFFLNAKGSSWPKTKKKKKFKIIKIIFIWKIYIYIEKRSARSRRPNRTKMCLPCERFFFFSNYFIILTLFIFLYFFLFYVKELWG